MAEAVYILCAATAIACAVLLWRGYRRSRARFLLWSSVCFMALAANNILLFVDLILLRNIDLTLPRNLTAVLGLAVMLYGLIFDAE